MSNSTRAFMIEITEDEPLKGKWDIVLNQEGYISISAIGHQDEIQYSGMVHLGDYEFQKLWDIVGNIPAEVHYDEIPKLIDSELEGILKLLVLHLKELLNTQMDYS